MLLFAYGSNMDVDTFKQKVPSAQKISNAKLPGYNFSFGLAADDGSSKASLNLSEETDAAVWGVLIQFNDDELDNFFFQQEWFEWATVNCLDDKGEFCKAKAFVTKPHAINNFTLPYQRYHSRIIKIAKAQGLPDEYITQLVQMPYKADPEK